MKRAAKKLTLFKETLRRLDSGQLRNIVGEVIATNGCPSVDELTCGCETGTACQISLCICQ